MPNKPPHPPRCCSFSFLILKLLENCHPLQEPHEPLHPAYLRGCTIITIIVVFVCLLFLQLIKKKKVHHPLIMPIKSSHTLQESKFKKVFNLTVGTPELTICFSPKIQRKARGKKSEKTQSLVIFMLGIDARK